MPRCLHCNTKFEKTKNWQQGKLRFCVLTDDCYNAMIEALKVKQMKWREKESKAKTKEMKEALKTNSEYIQEFQTVFNQYIRLRDKDLPCISCDTMSDVQYCAGHYYHAGGYPELRFNEDNVHKQCNKSCNLHLSGNPLEYRPRLIARIGEERFKALESFKNIPRKYSIPELKEQKVIYRDKIKELKRTL